MFKIQRHADNYFFKKLAIPVAAPESGGAGGVNPDTDPADTATGGDNEPVIIETESIVGPHQPPSVVEIPMDPPEGATLSVKVPLADSASGSGDGLDSSVQVGEGKTLYFRRLYSGGPLVWANFEGAADTSFPHPKVYWLQDGRAAKFVKMLGAHDHENPPDISECTQPACSNWRGVTAAAISIAWYQDMTAGGGEFASMTGGPVGASPSEVNEEEAAPEEAATELGVIDTRPDPDSEQAAEPSEQAAVEPSEAWLRYFKGHRRMIEGLYKRRGEDPPEGKLDEKEEEARAVWSTWVEHADAWGMSNSYDDWTQWYKDQHLAEGGEKWQHGTWSDSLKYYMRPEQAIAVMSNPPQSSDAWDHNGKKAGIINDLVSLANNLDIRGYRKESNLIDRAVIKMSRKA
tara:strand:+ start:53270 stop:54478 length:1209 start_codon:yes stop_codon:yes gene_type:complete